MDDSIEIEDELYKILAGFWDEILKGHPIPPYTLFNLVPRFQPMPKEHRFAWCKAMNILDDYGVISSFTPTTPGGEWTIEMQFTSEEEYDDNIYYTYGQFSRQKFKEFCKERGIDLTRPIKLSYSARLILNKENILMVDIDDIERLIYKKLGKGTGREILQLLTRVKLRRDKYHTEADLMEVGNDKRILGALSLQPLNLEKDKPLTEYFKTGLLNDVVREVITLDPHGICVPEQKDITPAQLRRLRDLATHIERK